MEFFVISANSEVFNLKFMDQDWPTALPSLGNCATAKSISIASMRHIRHNNPLDRTFLRRDSGGWIKIQDLPHFYVGRDMAPINEYVTKNGHLFGTPAVAAMGAYIACFQDCFTLLRKTHGELSFETASKPEYIFQRLAAKKDDATFTFLRHTQ